MRVRRRHRGRDGAAEPPHEVCEIRSFESTHVGSLRHFDFHFGKLCIITGDGTVTAPIALAVIDDYSRLICHVQWYLSETTRDLIHGFSQALMKRGLSGAVMTDNGSAMSAAEFTEGLLRLGITHRSTMAYSLHQNAKMEALWGPLEGRLVAMVEGLSGRLTLDELNRVTMALVESETLRTPIARFFDGPSVMRPCPEPAALRAAFRLEERRTERRSDGTVIIGGVCFEVPQALRHVQILHVRYARWDLRYFDVIDERTGVVVCALQALDRAKNADSRRRLVTAGATAVAPRSVGMAPLLEKLISDYESTGFPPAFVSQATDEEIPAMVLSEIRVLSSIAFDSRAILTVILPVICGCRNASGPQNSSR